MKDLKKEIAKKIKEKKIQPIPKWLILVKNYLIWALWGGLVLISAVFLLLIVFHLSGVGPELIHLLRIRRSFWLILQAIPFLLIGLMSLVLILGYVVFRKTKRGYRYSSLLVATVIALTLVGLTFGFHLVNQSRLRPLNKFSQTPALGHFFEWDKSRLDQPEKGILAGVIRKIEKEEIMMESFHGQLWKVKFEEEEIRGPFWKLEQGQEIFVAGEIEERETFQAQVIRPLMPKGPERLNEMRKREMPKPGMERQGLDWIRQLDS